MRVDVSSIALRRDFLFSLGLVVLTEGNSSVVVGDSVSPRPIGGRVPIPLGIVFGEGFALEAPYGLAAEEA